MELHDSRKEPVAKVPTVKVTRSSELLLSFFSLSHKNRNLRKLTGEVALDSAMVNWSLHGAAETAAIAK